MSACLSFSDILQVGQPQLVEMQRIGNLYSSAEVPGACEAFSYQVRHVEGVVIYTYGVAATLAKKAENLNEVADIWKRMSQFCQPALVSLAELKYKYPYCGTAALYDLILDYKLAADKRYKGALEEATCQKADFPMGLLPKLS